MLRAGWGAIAATAFAIALIFFLRLTTNSAPAKAGTRAESNAVSALGSFYPKRLGAAANGSDIAENFSARWQNVQAESATKFARDNGSAQAELGSARSPFDERFLLKQPNAPSVPLQRTASFEDRFVGDFRAADGTAQSAAVLPHPKVARVAATKGTPTLAARPTVAQTAPKRTPQSRFRLASASATSLPLAYAPSNSVKGPATTGSALTDWALTVAKPLSDVVTSRTAIYDITSQTVYLPNGRRLEAHSGLGDKMDDPRYVSARHIGPTPPNVYELKLRETLFHGIRAIRLIPADGSKMYGRDGILAHSYLLGPNGQSNGCVSISDYNAFLDAFMRGEVDRLVVVERLADPPSPKTASDWLKDIFRRS